MLTVLSTHLPPTAKDGLSKQQKPLKHWAILLAMLSLQSPWLFMPVISLQTPKKKQLLEQAIELARKAIESDSENADGYLWLSRALGRHSDHISKAQATKENYAKQTREAIEHALQIDPQMSAAHISMGRWHTGIIDRIGRLMGRTLFGARKKDALQHFDQAYELNQQSKANNLSLAIGLIELDQDKFSDRAHNLLKQAAELPINDAYEKILHERIIEKLTALEMSRN